MKISIRKMKPDDSVYAARLMMRAVNDLRKKSGLGPFPFKPTRKRNPMMCHLMKTDPNGAYVAYNGDRMVGYGQAMLRDGHWYLANLFTDPHSQNKGIGRKLLKKTLSITNSQEVHTHSLCTFSYNPLAVALYISFGLYPIQIFPMMVLINDEKKPVRKFKNEFSFKAVPTKDYGQIEILNRLDKINRGVYRPEDHKFWIDNERHQGYIFYHGRKVAGYADIIDNTVIAPVNASSPEYLVPLLIETINIALSNKAKKVIVWVPGTRGDILEFLLKKQFRIEENEILMSDRMFYDEACYIPASLAFF